MSDIRKKPARARYDRETVVSRALAKLTSDESVLLRAMRYWTTDQELEAARSLGLQRATRAMGELHRKKLVGRPDGGYLTNVGMDVADLAAATRREDESSQET